MRVQSLVSLSFASATLALYEVHSAISSTAAVATTTSTPPSYGYGTYPSGGASSSKASISSGSPFSTLPASSSRYYSASNGTTKASTSTKAPTTSTQTSSSAPYPTGSYNGASVTSASKGTSMPYGTGSLSTYIKPSSAFTNATSTTVVKTSTSSKPTSTDSCSYWLEDVKPQGIAAFNDSPGTYKVFRNVKDFGAKGDGKSDDTGAIQNAISSGGRCAPDGTCNGTTTSPALVYFPAGTYLVSKPIVDYYYTQLVGNPNCMPVIKASADFTARYVLDGDSYLSNGNLAWVSTNIFWRQVRNFVFDLTAVSPSVQVAGVHWPTGQATSLQNLVFKMSTAAGNLHEGLFIESGSGGFVNDLVFYGGRYGLNVGNQQFTMRNLTFYGSTVAVNQLWDWGWTYQGLSINDCQIGLNLSSLSDAGDQTVASVVLLDSQITNTPIGVLSGRSDSSTPPSGGSLILENVSLKNVPVAVQGPNQATYLAGTTGASTIPAWGQGHSYTTAGGPTVFRDSIAPNARPGSLTSGSDYYERSRPQYETVPASQFLSARDAGAKGDGTTDDTKALNQAIQDALKAGKILYLNSGYYKVSSTIYIPAGSKIVGESLPVIMSSGSFFADQANPKPVVQVGKPGESGVVEWSDAIVSSQGAQAGAILIQIDLASPFNMPTGLWEVHTRVGGFAGSQLQYAECPVTPTVAVSSAADVKAECIAAYASIFITKSAQGVYLENTWFWVADHDIEDPALRQITVYAGRGMLIQSLAGGIWLYGTAVEHHVLYQYQLSGTKDVVMGQVQIETAYYQPNPYAGIPFTPNAAINDPVYPAGASGWGVRVVDSSSVLMYGVGLYSFFDNNDVSCSQQTDAARCQSHILSSENSKISVYNLNTVGTQYMITADGVDLANYADNGNGFVASVALFRS